MKGWADFKLVCDLKLSVMTPIFKFKCTLKYLPERNPAELLLLKMNIACLIQNTVAVVDVLKTLRFSSSRDGNSVGLSKGARGKVFWVAVAVSMLGERVVLHPCSVSSCVRAVHRRVHVTVRW